MVLLIIMFPLFVLIIVAYLLTLNLPLFFFQDRIGRDLQPFRMVKFRTLKDVESQKSLMSRQFLLGTILRFLSLDELPQLIQVLSGKMSLVGPRPLPVAYLESMTEEQRKRHQLLPGISGLTQIQRRHQISWEKKFELDLYYLNHVSFKLDFIILLKTIVLLLSFRQDKSLQEEALKKQ